jgi:acyl transferase domain-containing protein
MSDGSNDDLIAIVGMAGRFPGANNIDQFWNNLKEGREALSFLTAQELRASGVGEETLTHPDYVSAAMKLEGIEFFDGKFFGYSPQQSASIDPQQRLFLECAWGAIENAGYNVETCSRSIGVFAGAGVNQYLLTNLAALRPKHFSDQFQMFIDSDKDFLTTRVSYKLNLSGPSVTIQTACSTSLVAVHLACQSLFNFECDLALAGGVSIQIPVDRGYVHEEGGILSSDGHCRAFDARADGTIAGSGVAIVVLKRLTDAVNDCDSICAVIKGSAINNDGALKVGYTAPGVFGQSRVIAAAMAFAQIGPRNIELVEAHGTGTAIGDAIELTALTETFRAKTDDRQFCALGSVKTNVGHLDTAAGVTGLIKAALCLKNKALVPSLHFENPNPILAKAEGPFYVNTTFRAWPRGTQPRCAAVSSFGIGGTNAHVILEEAPAQPSTEVEPGHHLVILSARGDNELAVAVNNLAEHTKTHPETSIADLAYTLQVGRKRFSCRKAFTARGLDDLRTTLEAGAVNAFNDPARDDDYERPVVFLFPGQGAQFADSASDLYQTESFFRKKLDECATCLMPRIGMDIREIACGNPSDRSFSGLAASIAQPVLFAIEYSMAALWMHWGITPAAMIGHSFGEYVAVCLADACSLDEAIDMVVSRAKAIADLSPGAMIAVGAGERHLAQIVCPPLALAAINAPERCAVSGPVTEIEKFAENLTAKGIAWSRLPVSYAFHSPMMEPAIGAIMDAVSRISFRVPQIPLVSCLTGKWATHADISSPAYWAAHARSPVQFSAALTELYQDQQYIFLEVGPGESLTRFVRQQGRKSNVFAALSSLKDGIRNDQPAFLRVLGQLWLNGAAVDWSRFHAGLQRRRVALPTYPFERQRHWFDHKSGDWPDNVADRAVPRSVTTSPIGSGSYVAPRTRLERAIVDVWTEVLGIRDVGVESSFLELGGDSLAALRLVTRLRELFNVELPLKMILQSDLTVATLAVQLVYQLARLQDGDRVRQEIVSVEQGSVSQASSK